MRLFSIFQQQISVEKNHQLCSIHQQNNHPASMCPAEQARWRPVSPREEVSSDPIRSRLRCTSALPDPLPGAPGAHAHRSLLASRRYWTWKGWKGHRPSDFSAKTSQKCRGFCTSQRARGASERLDESACPNFPSVHVKLDMKNLLMSQDMSYIVT